MTAGYLTTDIVVIIALVVVLGLLKEKKNVFFVELKICF
jgi:hypothetical protein